MRFYTPYQRTVLIQCDSLPIGIGSFGGIEGIVIGLIKVGPVILAYPQLNISRLTAGCEYTGARREGQLDIRVCKGRLNVAAADLCPIDPCTHGLRTVLGEVITKFEIA